MLALARKIAIGLAALALMAACVPLEGDNRHLQPLSQVTKSRLSQIDSAPGARMLVRIFKEESTLEVWKQNSAGAYVFFKDYEICAWSGELGPKIREGDRQSPEGFYSITPGRMNPKSSYYLSFDTGYPNKFDRAYGRTGSNLMVHGDCSSRGCYAMTDEQIAEIYALGRESFSGGQREFDLQIFPFRMTAKNMARHQSSPHFDFWKNLKTGYDVFEITKQPPDWDVCDRTYVYNVKSANGRSLNPTATCPPLSQDSALAARLAEIAAADEKLYAEAVVDAAEAEAKRVAAAEQAAANAAASAEREEAINTAMSGFFDGLFGDLFGGGDTDTPVPAEPIVAPKPAAPIQR